MGIKPGTFDREDGWVKNLFTGGSGFPGWIPMDPRSDEGYVPTWPTPQEFPKPPVPRGK